jgi:hypothetical protein
MNIFLESGFEIIYSDKMSYEKIIIEIEYNQKPVAWIIKRSDNNIVLIRIHTRYVKPEELSQFKFPFDDFIEAINQARIILDSLMSI